MPTKKSAKKKQPAKKAAQKTATKKAAVKKTPARKAATRKPATKKPAEKKVAEKVEVKKEAKPKARDLIKQSSHTPAIFKGATRRTVNILFTLQDVRDLLKKRSEEDQREKAETSNNGNPQAARKTVANSTVVSEATEQKSKHQAASLDDILGIASQGPAGQPG